MCVVVQLLHQLCTIAQTFPLELIHGTERNEMELWSKTWNSGRTLQDGQNLAAEAPRFRLLHQTIRLAIHRQSVSQVLMFPPEATGPRLDLYDFYRL